MCCVGLITEDHNSHKHSQSPLTKEYANYTSLKLDQLVREVTSTAVRLMMGRMPVGTIYRSPRFGGAKGKSSPFI